MRVVTADATWLFEVKSTTEEEAQFTLGHAEVRKTGDLELDEEYVIVFVTRVLDPARRRIHSLPNPMGTGSIRFYQVARRALRLQFELPPSPP